MGSQAARPLYGDEYDYPSVSSVAEQGDHIERGDSFYIFDENRTSDVEPIASYRQSSLDTLAAAATDVISTWAISPVAVTTMPYSVHRGIDTIPA